MCNIRLVFLLLTSAIVVGCTHPITITPNLNLLESSPVENRLNKSAGYFISQEQRDLEVTTPGGGGDSISYFPYRDIETGLYLILRNVFSDVRVLDTKDTQVIKQHAVDYVIEPVISTDSSSSNILFWAPLAFTVNLTCKVQNTEGEEIANPIVTGQGYAAATETHSNFGIAGQRAMENALIRMRKALLQLPELKE